MGEKLFSKILINLDQILNIQAPIMDEVKSSIQNMDNFALNKFNRYCGILILDIKNGQTSVPIDLLAEDELLIYLTVPTNTPYSFRCHTR